MQPVSKTHGEENLIYPQNTDSRAWAAGRSHSTRIIAGSGCDAYDRQMRTPTIHRNGTSPDELTRQIAEAGVALRHAMKALSDAAPHGRDYYPQGPDALQDAVREYNTRMERLESVYRDLTELHQAIADVMAARESVRRRYRG